MKRTKRSKNALMLRGSDRGKVVRVSQIDLERETCLIKIFGRKDPKTGTRKLVRRYPAVLDDLDFRFVRKR